MEVLMTVTLLHNTPLTVADMAIGKCWDKPTPDGEPCNINRIIRVANKSKHASTIEHLSYSFDIDGVSRALLQELARHRIASYSVKSTRYTLKELEGHIGTYNEFLVSTGDEELDYLITRHLVEVQNFIEEKNLANDKLKYALPEAYKTSLVMTVNARSLQNFLALRTNKAALWEIRELAYEVFRQLPDDHKFLFEEFLYDGDKPEGVR
jgi:thymidylate synthase (FAD)